MALGSNFLTLDKKRLVYRKANSYGLMLHSNGWGINADFINTENYFNRKFYRFEVINLKHPKEFKNRNGLGRSLNSQKSYVFGKINSFYNVNVTRGQMNLIADKGRKNGVELSWLYAYGISLGILKPYYISYCDEFIDCNNRKNIKYSEENENFFLDPPKSVVSKGPSNLGWKEIKLHPGLQAKIGLNADFAVFEELVQALEFGIMINAYLKRIPTMLNTPNRFIYPNLYIKASMGKRVY